MESLEACQSLGKHCEFFNDGFSLLHRIHEKPDLKHSEQLLGFLAQEAIAFSVEAVVFNVEDNDLCCDSPLTANQLDNRGERP